MRRKLVGYENRPAGQFVEIYRIYENRTDNSNALVGREVVYLQTLYFWDGHVSVWAGSRVKCSEGWETLEFIKNGVVVHSD